MRGEISTDYARDNRAGVYLHPMPISSTRTPEERECNFNNRRCIRHEEIPHAAIAAIAEPLNMGFLLIAHY